MTLGFAAPALDLDEFRLVRVLGQGGMGAVYLAYDTVLERDVAIKVLRERSNDEDARIRFLTEARAIARLDHPNVIAIYRAATTRDGHPYFVQELVRGSSLDRMQLPLEPRRVVEIALGIARGLAAAHRRGILHRDIKPANVMLDPQGTPKLLDFGVAKMTAAQAQASPPTAKQRPAATTAPRDPAAQNTTAVAETLETPDSPAALRTTDDDVIVHETETGVVVGTPRYMAPEIWRGEPATARSDLYSFGVLVYELASGLPPHAQADRLSLAESVARTDPAPLATVAPALDAELAALAMACLARDPAQRPESADAIVYRIERILGGAPPLPDGNPYPGLAPFGADHRGVFYGRGSDISAVVDRLRSDPLVVVAGDSGVGKSSLCRAGVVPAIVAGALADTRTWTCKTIAIGRHAAQSLRESLALAASDLTMTEVSRAVGASASTGTLIFLDQFEELVTLNDVEDAFIAATIVAQLARGMPGVKVLVAVRGDFLTRVAALPGLGPLLARSLHLLRPLSLADARDAVTSPARDKGVRFESEALVDTLASAAVDEPGALPLLSFALAELWQRRDVERAVIPAAALDAIGGVAGGLARHADSTIAGLGQPERAAARRIALRLVTAEGTRAERTRAELCPDDDPAAATALEAMIRGRLVLARTTPRGESVYEFAHDSLIDAWETLRTWRDDVAGQRALRSRLAAAADEWRRLDRRRDALWNRAQLAEIAALDDLSDGDRAFVDASRRVVRRRRAITIAIAASLPAVAAATWYVIRHQTLAERDRAVEQHVAAAETNLQTAEHARDDAQRDLAEAFRLFDVATEQGSAVAEAAWLRARHAEELAHDSYQAASNELEKALSIDPGRRDVRARLARVVYDRALLAELERDQVTADEGARRLDALDDDRKLYDAWRKPAQLTLDAPGAVRLELRRYEERNRRLELGEPLAAASSSRLVRDLDPGSYAVDIVGADGLVVHYPVVLGRAEAYAIAVPLPHSADIPAGMIYIPPGRFLAGAATADEVYRRAFQKTAPLHAVTTGAYLISRTEVTFADWMTYLRALRPEQRELRRPASANHLSILTGGNEPGEPFTIHFPSSTSEVVAAEGKPLVFTDRTRRREVRWEATPVVGVSFEDLHAYAAWLATTQRLRGARPCTNLEWERAARGADGRLWSQGDSFDADQADDANIDVTYGKKTHAYGTDEVGSHPRSTSPFGLVDTVGNVWELVAGPGDTAVMRGGGFYHGIASALAANLEPNEATVRQIWAGLRMCADPP